MEAANEVRESGYDHPSRAYQPAHPDSPAKDVVMAVEASSTAEMTHVATDPRLSSSLTPAVTISDPTVSSDFDLRVDPATRPSTAYTWRREREVNSAFTRFDGVHFTDGRRRGQEVIPARSSPPLEPALRTEIERGPNPGLALQNLVYYPAPVPRVLNLPQRLSRLPPPSSQKNRWSQAEEARPRITTSRATWQPKSGTVGMPEQSSVNPPEGFGALAALPPQLRASVFFEHPSTYQEVSIKQQSAVATLDSILDASAYAPVSAFTDHPFAAHLGAPSLPREPARVRSSEITGSKVRKKNSWSSLSNLLDAGSSRPTRTLGRRSVSIDLLSQFGRRKSETLDGLDPQDRAPLASSRSSRSGGSNDRPGEESRSIPAAELAPAREDEMGIEGQMESLPGNARSPLHYAQPTTLLAELQLRKVQQRQRNMTAATAFPNGMHSTLLELDTVAEVQKLSRKHKRITLAWEDPNRPEIGPAIEDDDVPLGMLFPTIKNRAPSDERPSGLLEQRHQEENEPLSRRRDRLRASGGVMPRAAHSARLMRGGMSVNLPGVFDPMEDDDALDEDETLAERARRLKGGSGSRRPSHGRRLSSEFATELLGPFGALHLEAGPDQEGGEEEETLAQRRQRLRSQPGPQLPHVGRPGKVGADSGHAGQQSAVPGRISWAASNVPRAPAALQVATMGHQSSAHLSRNGQPPNLLPGGQSMMSPLGDVAQRGGGYGGHPALTRRGSGPVLHPPNLRNSVAYANHPSMPGRAGAGVAPGSGNGLWAMSSPYFTAPPPSLLPSNRRDMIDEWRSSIMP